MGNRKDLIERLLSTKTTLEIISELRKLPMEETELHVIPYFTKVYRVNHGDCSQCCFYDCGGGFYGRKSYCEAKSRDNFSKERYCVPDVVEEGIYAGNDDEDLGIKTFFTEKEALSRKNIS